MQTISVYINQNASHASQSSGDLRHKIEATLFRSNLQFKQPKDSLALDQSLEQDIDQKVDAIVSVGGDGTANTIIQKIAGTDIGLLVVPGGTANDLAHELGNHKSLQNVLQSIRNKEFKKIDLIKINGRFMATNGGIGFGGKVAQKINRLRAAYPMFKKVMHLSGSKIYSLFVAQELLSLHLDRHRIKVTSKELSGVFDVAALFVNNQSTVAGKFELAPFTANNDGRFNVILVTHQNRAQLINCVIKVSMGHFPENDPNFITFETDKIEIESLESEKGIFFGDGEILGQGPKWEVEVVKDCLKVFTRCSKNADLPLPQNFGLS